MDLSQAIQKHAEWKIKFLGAIKKKETLDALAIGKDNCCDLGKWLHSDGKSKFSSLGAYSECVGKHAAFHVVAGKIAEEINAKKYTEAEAMLGASTPFAEASNEVATAIIRLKQEAGL